MTPLPPQTGTVVGYDPGGNGRHGLALLEVRDGQPRALRASTRGTVEDVVLAVEALPSPLALGVDTLTCWGTGRSGWRPADRWLRGAYADVGGSTVAPNSLYGSMALGGGAVVMAARARTEGLYVTEAHPKVLCRALFGRPYAYGPDPRGMDAALADALGVPVRTANDHEWDAAASALAAWRGLTGAWALDLHALPTGPDERLVRPYGPTAYAWPDGPSPTA